jgi:DNA-binding beta-propeller fold protein YncE
MTKAARDGHHQSVSKESDLVAGAGRGGRARSHLARVVTVLCALIGVLALASAPALAARGHVFEKTFGSPGTGPGELSAPAGVAVNDASGDVYVVDAGNSRVQFFDSQGAVLGELNGSGLLVGEGAAAGSRGRPNEKETGQFVNPEGIAVDNACTRAAEAAGHPLSASECEALDPSYGDVYVADTGHGVIDKFSSSGEYLAQISETSSGTPFKELLGVAVDPHGDVLVYQDESGVEETGEIDTYNDALVNEFEVSHPSQASVFAVPGFAVDGQERLYVEHRLVKVVAQLSSSGAVLREEVDGETSATGLAADQVTNEAFIDEGETVGVFDPSGRLLERLGSGHLTGGSGVGVNDATETVYVADASAGVIDVFAPRPLGVPSVDSQSVSDITATSATFRAEINPHGDATHYRFEYGVCPSAATCPTSAYEKSLPVPDGTIEAGFDDQTVSVSPLDLVGGTTYHYRVVAENSHGLAEGIVEAIFVTQATGGFALPDGRAWELVSPPEKHGSLIETIGAEQVTQASLDGHAMTYVAAAPVTGEPEGFSNKVQVLSTRTSSGWQSHDVAPPHEVASGLSQASGQEYRAFSEDLALAIVQPFGPFIPASSPQALAPQEASEQTAFARSMFTSLETDRVCTTSCYRPLVTALPGHANVPEDTVFGQTGGGERPCPPEVICGPRFVGASPDLKSVVLESNVPLGSPISKDVTNEDGLYEWIGGQLRPVSLLTNGESIGSHPHLGRLNQVARGAVSADGDRVFFSEREGEHHLYMRETDTGETVQLDAVQGGNGENSPNAAFQFASRDGTRVFFTDAQHLTADAGGGSGNSSHKEDDLYECEIVVAGGQVACNLTDLTPVREGEPAQVLDEVLGASEEGTYVYFVANGVQGAGATPGTCAGLSSPPGAKCNLYVAHFDGSNWTTSFVASLSAEDYPDWNGQASQTFLANMPSRVSPNGHWLAFMSIEPLTGYDTHDASSGTRDEEVYLYHAGEGTRSLACASCNPSGARPHGVEYKDLRFGADGLQVWEGDQMIASSVPAWTSYNSGTALYQSRYLSNDGRLFFNSRDALVAQDVNGTGDVYEYEPAQGHAEGGRCGPPSGGGSNVLKPEHAFDIAGVKGLEPGGCVGLISSGGSRDESDFLDASETGEDVFFLTAARLTSQDTDTTFDVYDAHRCTSSSPCSSTPTEAPPPCDNGEACKAAPTPQPSIFGAPSSATFAGAGNVAPPTSAPAVKPKPKPPTRAQELARALKACKRVSKQKRPACERRARQRYSPKHKAKKAAKKANNPKSSAKGGK